MTGYNVITYDGGVGQLTNEKVVKPNTNTVKNVTFGSRIGDYFTIKKELYHRTSPVELLTNLNTAFQDRVGLEASLREAGIYDVDLADAFKPEMLETIADLPKGVYQEPLLFTNIHTIARDAQEFLTPKGIDYLTALIESYVPEEGIKGYIIQATGHKSNQGWYFAPNDGGGSGGSPDQDPHKLKNNNGDYDTDQEKRTINAYRVLSPLILVAVLATACAGAAQQESQDTESNGDTAGAVPNADQQGEQQLEPAVVDNVDVAELIGTIAGVEGVIVMNGVTYNLVPGEGQSLEAYITRGKDTYSPALLVYTHDGVAPLQVDISPLEGQPFYDDLISEITESDADLSDQLAVATAIAQTQTAEALQNQLYEIQVRPDLEMTVDQFTVSFVQEKGIEETFDISLKYAEIARAFNTTPTNQNSPASVIEVNDGAAIYDIFKELAGFDVTWTDNDTTQVTAAIYRQNGELVRELGEIPFTPNDDGTYSATVLDRGEAFKLQEEFGQEDILVRMTFIGEDRGETDTTIRLTRDYYHQEGDGLTIIREAEQSFTLENKGDGNFKLGGNIVDYLHDHPELEDKLFLSLDGVRSKLIDVIERGDISFNIKYEEDGHSLTIYYENDPLSSASFNVPKPVPNTSNQGTDGDATPDDEPPPSWGD